MDVTRTHTYARSFSGREFFEHTYTVRDGLRMWSAVTSDGRVSLIDSKSIHGTWTTVKLDGRVGRMVSEAVLEAERNQPALTTAK